MGSDAQLAAQLNKQNNL